MKDVNEIIQRMSREEKIALCEGKDFWTTKAFPQYGIPTIFMSDGPHGLRKQEDAADMLGLNRSLPATCFPTAVTTGASWDTELLDEIGKAIAQEAKAQGVGLVLGPGANLKRNPLCGRNFEYFSEDPYLTGKLAAAYIRGAESEGVATSLKHLAANSQERDRFTSDSVMDERTMRELYLSAFETAIKEGKPSTVMCAYPKLNGTHCSDNKALLTDILRAEWGFDGLVVTDWGAMNNRVEAFRAGCDLNMPGGSNYMIRETIDAVKRGDLPESAIDACAARVLRLVLRADENKSKQASCDYDAHKVVARKAALSGAVLLKNEDHLLPLAKTVRLAVIGTMAQEPRYQGAGSSHINPTRLTIPLDCFPGAVFAAGCDSRGDTSDALLEEARTVAAGAEVTIVFAGLPDRYESEGFDRENMQMPEGHNRMIEAIAEANPNTIVVLLTGSPVETPWADKVKAILYMGLMGQEGGAVISDLIYGAANPCGKLAESWPISYEDCPSSSYYGKTKDALYREGIYVGYRFYDKARTAVRFPFGFGLSYTTFAYSDLVVTGNTAEAVVINTGNRAGAEIAQLYIEAPQVGIHRPLRELKGFQKVFLQPGESRQIAFKLDERAFAVWQNGWKVPAGEYTVCVGSSSRDLPLRAVVHRGDETLEVPDWQADSWYEAPKGVPSVEEFERMLGRAYIPPKLIKGLFTMDHTVAEMKDFSLLMKIMYKAVEKTIAKGFGGKVDYENPEFRMMMASSAGSPLRSMQIFGGLKNGVVHAMLEIANGHLLKGIVRMFGK
ncbi:glycoside hydrolase family 3 C-terminal domain-containing protein [Streptococcus moroccensis]|uniref:Beta-glucosidase n=1 Tax=Streptococcus moroccensis TaxID=1451356 RepID=A0ABT9YRG3_9STRE|nr:glycoside hydrolase family 3 C-terminal domain-containing protein [Streptococcus moroccensis]MDQ0222360.1 beta-glucosidase [Streptococcus moroccensis]